MTNEEMMEIPKFQVGVYHDLNSADPWFHDERDAINHAAKLHSESSPFGKEPVGIWDSDRRLLWLFFDGMRLRSV